MILITPLMKAVTGLLLLSVAIYNTDSALSVIVTGTYSPYGIGLLARWLLHAAAGLWFLMPGLFDRSIARWSAGPARLVLDIALFGIGLWLMLYWLFLIVAPASFLAPHMPRVAILLFGIAWCVAYVLTFLFPGYAFRRLEPAPEVPTMRVGATENRAILTQTAAPPVLPVPKQVGWVRKLLLLASVLPLCGSLLGQLFPIWLPSEEVLRLAAMWWWTALAVTVLALVIGTHGTTLNLEASRMRSQGQAKLFIVGGILALSAVGMTNFLTKSLPWAWSFVAGTEPAHAELVVTHLGKAHRRRGCDYLVTVAWPQDLSHTTTICELPPDLWSSLHPGDRISAEGKGNRWGMTYPVVARID